MGLARSSGPDEVILGQNRRFQVFATKQILISPESCLNPEDLVLGSSVQERRPLGLDRSSWVDHGPAVRNQHQQL